MDRPDHVLRHRGIKLVPPDADAFDAGTRAGIEDQLVVATRAERHQRALFEAAKILAQGGDIGAIEDALEVGGQRQGQLCRLAILQPEIFIFEEADSPDRQRHGFVACVKDGRGRQHILGPAFIQHGRLGNGRAARPRFHDPGIAGLGGAVLRRGKEKGVIIQPGCVGLGFRQAETVHGPFARLQIELPHHHGIAATARQPDQGTAFAGRHFAAAENPVFLFRLRQGVDVQQHIPVRRLVLVIGDGRAPPEALGVLRVLPEIVGEAVIEAGIGNAVGRIQHLQHALVVGVIARVGLQRPQRTLVLCRHPFQRLDAMHVFQPGIRVCIIVRSGQGEGSRGSKQHQKEAQHLAHG